MLLCALLMAGPGRSRMTAGGGEPDSAVMAGVAIVAGALQDPVEDEAGRIAEDVRELGEFLLTCVTPGG